MRIRAYRALRPRPELANRVASLPYDVVSTDEARELAKGNPLSMLHVVRAEIDLPPGTDPHSDNVYAQAVQNFRKLCNDGTLIYDESASLYLYEQQMGAHRQRGIAALCFVEDYEAGLIKKHEKTRKDKEDDRTRLTNDLSANPGPVFLTYRDQTSISLLAEQITKTSPLYDFCSQDGITHRVWRIDDPEPVIDAFGNVPAFYIADGHHRAASAARVGRERASTNPSHTGAEDYNAFLCVLFPASELKVLPYNRVVTDLNGLEADAFLRRLGSIAEITVTDQDKPDRVGDVCMYFNGTWHRIRFQTDSSLDPVARLDVSLLQDRVLSPLLGIDDPRTSDRIVFVGGIRGTQALVSAVDSRQAAVAFSMFPVTVAQLMEVADAGQIMPPKSTWFEPKLRSGLFMHTF